MTTRERIEQDFTKAMKERQASVVSTLRMLRSALKLAEIDKMKPLEEAEVVDMIGKEVKKLKDSETQFTAGNRQDLADAVRAEVALLQQYLPAQMDDASLAEVVKAKIAELSAAGPLTDKDFGRVMKEVVAATKGAADGGKVSKAVKEALAAK